jgi:hypothetical protein
MDHIDPHASSLGYCELADSVLPSLINDHHGICPHAMVGTARLGEYLDGHGRVVHLTVSCPTCTLTVSVSCFANVDEWTRTATDDPDT